MANVAVRTKQLTVTSSGEAFFHGGRGSLLGFDSPLDIAGPSLASSLKDLRRIGKIRMTWEESMSLWAEEGEVHRGRVRVQSSSFLNADELAFFDDAMIPCIMESFEDGPLKGFSVDRFVSGQQVKVFGRRKSSSASGGNTCFLNYFLSFTNARNLLTIYPLTFPGFTERVQLPFTEPTRCKSWFHACEQGKSWFFVNFVYSVLSSSL